MAPPTDCYQAAIRGRPGPGGLPLQATVQGWFHPRGVAVGGQRFKRRCVEKMRQAARSGRTVLFVSHDLDVLQRISDRAILIRNGRVELDGAPDRVVAEHI
ncbi:MAG: hypothetical protein MUP31_00510, partial [Xanthomonadales bacterium]|nr:hypothetical protein [Xanthomonadales bacterium]